MVKGSVHNMHMAWAVNWAQFTLVTVWFIFCIAVIGTLNFPCQLSNGYITLQKRVTKTTGTDMIIFTPPPHIPHDNYNFLYFFCIQMTSFPHKSLNLLYCFQIRCKVLYSFKFLEKNLRHIEIAQVKNFVNKTLSTFILLGIMTVFTDKFIKNYTLRVMHRCPENAGHSKSLKARCRLSIYVLYTLFMEYIHV